MKSSPEPSISPNHNQNGLVFNTQRYSIHDGPGIRTIVFVKGCPLHCIWCDNPEGQKSRPEIVFFADRCFGCSDCVEACSKLALLDQKGTIQILRDKCDLCGECIRACTSGALQQIGRTMTVAEVMEEVEKDRAFYEISGGGMTVSGGEPTMQPSFVEALLSVAQERGINTALETCGETQWPILERLLKFTDLVLYDIKAMDERVHKRLVGTSNAQILSNAAKAAEYRPLIVRVPVVPGMNDSEENIRAVAAFARRLKGVKEIHLLSYHRLGESKYPRLSIDYKIQGLAPPSQVLMHELEGIVSSYGLIVRIGG